MKISELPLAQSVSTTDDVPIDRSGVTYRVHYEALRGNGIASIAKTGTSGLVDTYTITFTDGSTFTYTVTNGASGSGSWGTITGTLSNQTDLQNALNAKLSSSALLDLVYPVGSIYMSVNNVSPATFIGGTWSSFAAGRVLVGVDANDTAFDTVEETGGEKAHTLVSNELPNITGSIRFRRYASDATRGVALGSDGVFSTAMETAGDTTPVQNNTGTGSAFQRVSMSFGNNQAHNNLQPYITCYMWKRTA